MLTPDGANIVIWCQEYTSEKVEPSLSSKCHLEYLLYIWFRKISQSAGLYDLGFFFLILINLFTLKSLQLGSAIVVLVFLSVALNRLDDYSFIDDPKSTIT